MIVGTAAELDLSTMAVTILDYSERALAERPDDASIHAVRTLGLALASPDQLDQAREAATRALELAPADEFLQQASAFLEAAERAPGLPPEAPPLEGAAARTLG